MKRDHNEAIGTLLILNMFALVMIVWLAAGFNQRISAMEKQLPEAAAHG